MPPAFPSLHDTVPVGTVGKLDVSATVTVNLTCDPLVVVAGFGVIVVLVPCNGFTVKVEVPELRECVLS